MRTRGIFTILVLCAVSAGCSEFLRSTVRNLTESPLLSTDEARMKHRNRERAEEAWRLLSEGSRREYSADFADGFKAGYADYLTNGGNGDPPAVPPFCYRTVRYQTPEGVDAINQWYSGWRHGAMMAKASGVREFEIVPLSAPPINAVEPYAEQFAPPPAVDTLPPPRPAPNK